MIADLLLFGLKEISPKKRQKKRGIDNYSPLKIISD
jgi:hypothetical protein